MSVIHILFIILSAIAIISGAMVVFKPNPIQNALQLIVCFFAIAGHYVLLNAQFLAAVHVIVYAGAIMVLFLFVIMLMNLNKETEPQHPAWEKIIAVVAGGIFFVVLVGALKGADAMTLQEKTDPNIGLVSNLGKVLFKDYLVPFELSSVLFLAAMVGAVMLGKKISSSMSSIQVIPINWYIMLSAGLFSLGVLGVLFRRNAIVILMSVELMLNAVNLLLAAFSAYHNDPKGQVFVFFIMAVAAAEVAVGLAILVMIYRNAKTTDVGFLNKLKW